MKDEIYVSFRNWCTTSNDTASWGILRYSCPNADQEISAQCWKRLKEKYGENPPKQIKDRLEKELWCLTGGAWCNSVYYLLASQIAKQCDSLGALHYIRGCGGASFAAFLAGITETNPLPPHKYCPDCGYAEFVDAAKYESGFDLWNNQKTLGACPHCGAKLTGDGHNLDSTHAFGEDRDMQPDFDFIIPCEVELPLMDFWRELGEIQVGLTEQEKDAVEHEIIHKGRDSKLDSGFFNFYTLQFQSLPMLSKITELEKATGVSARSILLKEIDIPAVFSADEDTEISYDREAFQLLTETLHPICFSDLVRAFGYANGINAWEENAERLIQSGILPRDTIAHRDDVLRMLLQRGVDRRTALRMMHATRKGRASRALNPETITTLLEKGVPEWYIASMRKIGYLPSKAHSVEFLIQYLRLIWYKCNFPDVFAQTTSEVFDGGDY